MKAMFDEAIRGRIQELGEENERLKTGIAALRAENERLKAACIKQNFAIEQILGRALDYTENDGTVNVCDYTAETLAECAADVINRFHVEVKRLNTELAVRERQAEILAGDGWSNGKTVEPFKSERLSKALAQSRAEIAKEAELKPEGKP